MNAASFESSVLIMENQWKDVKESLDNKVSCNDIMKKEPGFFYHFEQIISETKEMHEIGLNDVGIMLRGVKDKVDLKNYDRMIPKEEFSKKHNRMNPPGKAFVYAGTVRENKGKNYGVVKKHVTKTIINELRAVRGDTITLCKLNVSSSDSNKKIFNLCGDPDIPQDTRELDLFLQKKIIKSKTHAEIELIVKKILSNIYFNMFSTDNIFRPVESDENIIRRYEYAPFHMISEYFEDLGYVGLMYRSSVCRTGTNIVLFDPNLIEVDKDTMEHIIV